MNSARRTRIDWPALIFGMVTVVALVIGILLGLWGLAFVFTWWTS